MTQIQSSIFLTVALIVSIVANIFLFSENNNRQNDLVALTGQLEHANAQNKQRLEEQLQAGQRVNSMQSTQQDLSIMINDLQATLANLQTDYQNSRQTAQLTSDKFAKATEQAKLFQAELKKTKQQLQNAQATVANLERALRNKGNETPATTETDSLKLTELNNQLSLADPEKEIGIVQKSDGSIVLSIPLEKLFEPGTVVLSPQSAQVLKPIAQSLKSFSGRAIQIVGHSDERLITSALADKYPTNWELSSIRASKVLLALIEQGVDTTQLMVAGKAATQPVRDESGSSAWQINRRIEIIIE
ncbi:MAG: chemotaxis protein MotB [Reinekea sp.]